MSTRPPATRIADVDEDIERRLRGDSSDDSPINEAEPVKAPRDSDDERDEYGYPKQTEQTAEESMTPLHGWFTGIRKVAAAGSCCGSVAFLLLLTGWDHGWIPGLMSQFASATDFDELKEQRKSEKADLSKLVILNLAQAIRDIELEICQADSNARRLRLDELQLDYKARTGSNYPHGECPKSLVVGSLKG